MPRRAATSAAAACWSSDRSGPAPARAGGGGDSSLTRTASSEPAASMPVTTPALTPASRWSSADAIAPATPRISATRCRAAVSFSASGRRSGRRNSFRCGGGCRACGWLSAIFATLPIGAIVHAATRSRKSTKRGSRGGSAGTSQTAFNVSGGTSPSPGPRTMP